MRPCVEHDDLGCPMTRINRVDGEGPKPCPIMLIGEAPGKTEDKKGKPFCGKSGSELTHLYLGKCAQIDRSNVYVTNLVKCRTNEKDRDPTVMEIMACSALLFNEIQRVQPQFVGTIGRLATQFFRGADSRMEKVHGFGYRYKHYITIPADGRSARTTCSLLMPLYHPAFGLHNTAMMRHIAEDWTRFGKLVRGDESVMWRAR